MDSLTGHVAVYCDNAGVYSAFNKKNQTDLSQFFFRFLLNADIL